MSRDWRHRPLVVLVALGASLAAGAHGQMTPTATPSPTPSSTPLMTSSPTPTSTPTFARTPTLAMQTVAGAYSGSWATAGAAGTLMLTLAQSGESLTGTAIFDDHPCLGLTRFSGRISGNAINGTLSSLTSLAMGNTRLTATPAGLSGTFALLTGCSAAANGTLTLFASGPSAPRGTPTATPTRAAQTATPTATPSATPTQGAVGDCDGDGIVAVHEIVAMVSIGLSTRPLSLCPEADLDGDSAVTVDEILRGVFAALSGISDTQTPPPIVERCLALGSADCVCRGDLCCVSGACGAGEPCGETVDCRLGLRCQESPAGRVCADAGAVVVPPPR